MYEKIQEKIRYGQKSETRNNCEKVSCERINIGKVLRSKTKKISDKTKEDLDASNFNKVVDDNKNSALKKAVLRRSCVALKTTENIFWS